MVPWLAAGALATMPAPAAAQLAISQLHLVAGGPGVRDQPSVVATAHGYQVFWEEAPAPTLSDAPGRNYRILRQEVGLDGTLRGGPAVAVDRWSHQWAPSAVAAGDQTWLAYSYADRRLRAGAREIELDRYDGSFERPATTIGLTHGPGRGPPLNHSSPALLVDPETRALVVASSVGAWRGEPTARRRSFDSVNIEVRVLDSTGAQRSRWLVKGPDEVGEAATPSLAILPSHWRERYVLAYVSNAGDRDAGPNGFSVYFELYDRDWRVVGGRHFLHPTGGSARPSLATVDGKLYIAWVDNASNDIMVSELDQTLHPIWPMHLRAGLAEAGFAEQFGAGAPRLSAPMLYADGNQLGLAFVATWEWDPASSRARQEVFMGRVGYRQ